MPRKLKTKTAQKGKKAAMEDIMENIKSLQIQSFNQTTIYTEALISYIIIQSLNYAMIRKLD